MEQPIFDVIVVGGGPAGLSECIRLLDSGLEVAVVSDVFGGCMGMMGGHPLQSYCNELEIEGAPLALQQFMDKPCISPTGAEYAAYIRDNFAALPLTRVQQRVITVTQAQGVFEVSVGADSACTPLRAKQLILATGIRPKAPPFEAPAARWLNCFELYQLVAQGQAKQFRDQDVVIFGSGNSAFQLALLLAPFARNICILAKAYLGLYPQETDDRFALRSLSQRTLEMIAKTSSTAVQGPLNSAGLGRANIWLHAYSAIRQSGDQVVLQLPASLNGHPLLRASCRNALEAGRLVASPTGGGYELHLDAAAPHQCLVSAIGVTAQLPATQWSGLVNQQTGFTRHHQGRSPVAGLYFAGAASGYASINTMVPAAAGVSAAAPEPEGRLSWA
ncbi:FAD-dependent oxidoreductase [Pseudomonas sp. RIT-To-2]|uniref:FAD-dependent oxidoreductase n=1 Tax=Pseudomonas sp. RIT-To-2 TaxID=3462541 RepID=UPI002413573E